MLRKAVEARLRRSGRDEGPGDFVLSFLERFYLKATEKRNKAFDRGVSVKRLPVPVISVGNLAAGGTGKTPMTRAIAEILDREGIRVAILSRGYGGKYEKKGGKVSDGRDIFLSASDAGDEPFLLARTSPASVYVGKDRYKSGFSAVRDGAEILLLDDGFQHRGLYRDLDILLMDARAPLGNGHLLPRGILREAPWNLNRSDAIIFTRSAKPDETSFEKISAFTGKAFQQKTGIFYAGEDLFWCSRGGSLPEPGKEVFVFSGIADPDNFVQTLKEKGLIVKASRFFADHHRYPEKDLSELFREAKELKAEALVTTAKDAVKIPDRFFRTFNILVADVAPVFSDSDGFETWLKERISSLPNKSDTKE